MNPRRNLQSKCPSCGGPTTLSHEHKVFLNVKQTQILSGISSQINPTSNFAKKRTSRQDNQAHKDTRHLEQEPSKTINEQIHKDLRVELSNTDYSINNYTMF